MPNPINGYVIKFAKSAYPGNPGVVELRVLPTISQIPVQDPETQSFTYVERQDLTFELDTGINISVIKFPYAEGSQAASTSPSPASDLSVIIETIAGILQNTLNVLESTARPSVEQTIIGSTIPASTSTIQQILEQNPVYLSTEGQIDLQSTVDAKYNTNAIMVSDFNLTQIITTFINNDSRIAAFDKLGVSTDLANYITGLYDTYSTPFLETELPAGITATAQDIDNYDYTIPTVPLAQYADGLKLPAPDLTTQIFTALAGVIYAKAR